MTGIETLQELLAQPAADEEGFAGPIFTSIDHVPLGPPQAADGDDSLLEASGGAAVLDAPVKLSAVPLAAVNQQGKFVPFIREVKKGTVGKDVIAYKRALSKAGNLKWRTDWTTSFGATAVKATQTFQSKHGLKADGHIGPATHAKLARYIDGWGIYLLHQVHLQSPKEKAQALMRAAMVLTYNHRWSIHYTQGPFRMYGVRHHLHPPNYGIYEDCSSEYTWNCYVGGLPDPNGFGYNGLGFTGTISARCPRVTAPETGVASLYGYGFPYHHVTTVYGKRSDGSWIEHSHGSEMGPIFVAHAYRGDFAHFSTPFR